MRYDRLLQELVKKNPKCIVEIGTWNGARALQFLSIVPDAMYYGFDLFEDANDETDRVEFNVKAHFSVRDVSCLLGKRKFKLIKGNTRDTLLDFVPDMPVDFLWLDGGHSIETIRSDWENIKRHLAPDAAVFFDDYFDGPIDTTKIGCNEVVKDMLHEILPEADRVKGGGTTQIVRVLEW